MVKMRRATADRNNRAATAESPKSDHKVGFRRPSQRSSQNVSRTIADASMLNRLEQKKYFSL
jgi:hypothetical protein